MSIKKETMKTLLRIWAGSLKWCGVCKKYTIHDKVDGGWECRKCAGEW